jgi:hypothetical protein
LAATGLSARWTTCAEGARVRRRDGERKKRKKGTCRFEFRDLLLQHLNLLLRRLKLLPLGLKLLARVLVRRQRLQAELFVIVAVVERGAGGAVFPGTTTA